MGDVHYYYVKLSGNIGNYIFVIQFFNQYFLGFHTNFICTVLMIMDSVSEKHLYKETARDQEIIHEKEQLKKYLKDVKKIFGKYDLNDSALALLNCHN